jgi:hypothetical protein
LENLLAAEGEQLSRQAGRALGGCGNLLQFGLFVRVIAGDEKVRVAADHGEQIVEVVRDSAGSARISVYLTARKEAP